MVNLTVEHARKPSCQNIYVVNCNNPIKPSEIFGYQDRALDQQYIEVTNARRPNSDRPFGSIENEDHQFSKMTHKLRKIREQMSHKAPMENSKPQNPEINPHEKNMLDIFQPKFKSNLNHLKGPRNGPVSTPHERLSKISRVTGNSTETYDKKMSSAVQRKSRRLTDRVEFDYVEPNIVMRDVRASFIPEKEKQKMPLDLRKTIQNRLKKVTDPLKARFTALHTSTQLSKSHDRTFPRESHIAPILAASVEIAHIKRVPSDARSLVGIPEIEPYYNGPPLPMREMENSINWNEILDKLKPKGQNAKNKNKK